MAALKRSALLLAVAFSATALLSWRSSRLWPAPSSAGLPLAQEGQASAAGEPRLGLREVHTLRRQRGSAYHARLFATEDDVVLVTEEGFTVFRTGGSLEEHAISLGPLTARQGDAIIFWRAGWLRQVSISGGDERELIAVRRVPRHLLASEARLAWVNDDPVKGTSLQTLSGGHVRVVEQTALSVSAPVLRAADVYWVAVARDATWSIGRIDLDGQQRMSSEAHRGRPPAMLAVGHDGVYFYEGPQRGVRRLTFDLEHEVSVSTGIVCSPLAVSNRVVCSQVGGVFDLPRQHERPRFLASERHGPITALAVTADHAFWVAEDGNERLILRSVALPEP